MMINIHAAWIGFLLGCVSGAIFGLFFHKREWLGGYNSWERRLIRLGHISFFGLGFINLSFVLTIRALELDTGVSGAEFASGDFSGGQFVPTGFLLIVGAITMPLVCFLSAYKKPFRHLFFIPALSVTIGIALFVWKLLYI